MPPPSPSLNGKYSIASRQFSQVYNGQWGNGPLQTIYTAPSAVAMVLIYMQTLTAQNNNSPAFIVNIGSGANYSQGNIHNIANQPPIESPHGSGVAGLNLGLILNPNEAMTIQLANGGTFFIEFMIYEFTVAP